MKLDLLEQQNCGALGSLGSVWAKELLETTGCEQCWSFTETEEGNGAKRVADTQECESCQLNDMEVAMDENKEELSFIPSVLSSSFGWMAGKEGSSTSTSHQ